MRPSTRRCVADVTNDLYDCQAVIIMGKAVFQARSYTLVAPGERFVICVVRMAREKVRKGWF